MQVHVRASANTHVTDTKTNTNNSFYYSSSYQTQWCVNTIFLCSRVFPGADGHCASLYPDRSPSPKTPCPPSLFTLQHLPLAVPSSSSFSLRNPPRLPCPLPSALGANRSSHRSFDGCICGAKQAEAAIATHHEERAVFLLRPAHLLITKHDKVGHATTLSSLCPRRSRLGQLHVLLRHLPNLTTGRPLDTCIAS